MQRSLRILGCILLFLSGMNTFAQNSNSTEAQYVEGVVRVKLQPEVVARMTNALKPTKEGNFAGTIKLTDKNGNTHSFMVRGTSAIPATLQVDKSEFDLGDLKEGEEKANSLFAANTWKIDSKQMMKAMGIKKVKDSQKGLL